MIRLGECTPDELRRRLGGSGVTLTLGPFVVRLRSTLPEISRHLAFHYGEAPLVREPGIVDCDLAVTRGPSSLRSGPLARLWIDGHAPVAAFPRALAWPHVEWGINWAVATRAHQYLLVHAAVVQRAGEALVMPGLPGAGKSTLCAALVARGWHLLSDEFLILEPATGNALAMPRPISLKEASIAAVRSFAPETIIGPCFPGTHKGALAYMLVPGEALVADAPPARPGIIIFPSFAIGASARLSDVPKARAFFRLADNSFNYGIRGEASYEEVRDLVDGCRCYELAFDDLDAAVGAISVLHGKREPLSLEGDPA